MFAALAIDLAPLLSSLHAANDNILTTSKSGYKPSMFNRYAYVANDPGNRTDPDGKCGVPNPCTDQILFETVEYAFKPVYDFLAADAVDSVKAAANGDFSGAAKSVAFAAVKPLKIASRIKKTVCFEAGTPILTKTGKRPIESVAVGDMVWSSNPETGEAGWRRVEETFINDESTVWELTFADENKQATKLHRVTGAHPYWVVSPANDNHVGAWVTVNALKPDMQVQTKSGNTLTVLSVHDTGVIKRTYNFEVEDFHTYYVGDDEVLVHNACKKSKGQKRRRAKNKAKKKNGQYQKNNENTQSKRRSTLNKHQDGQTRKKNDKKRSNNQNKRREQE